MNRLKLPKRVNYISAFLTFKCNMGCTYCINHYAGLVNVDTMSGADWIEGLSRIPATNSLPITLSGGEPTLHPDFYDIVDSIPDGKVDLLTNGLFNTNEFLWKVRSSKFKRGAKYASIRFSLHQNTDLHALLKDVSNLKTMNHEVGIWAVNYPNLKHRIGLFSKLCARYGIDFRVKEFLGYYNLHLYGTYTYPNAIGNVESTVLCQPSELLIGPDGSIFRCHADLYAYRNHIGHILDKSFKFPSFDECTHYGNCNPCDIKLKFNRFQEHGHCSVDILTLPKNGERR